MSIHFCFKRFHRVLSILALLILIVLSSGCSHTSYLDADASEAEEKTEESGEEAEAGQAEHDQKPAVIYVQVAGAVKHPGVYELPADARVFQAIDEAGGLKENADGDALNQAEPLSDGQKITVAKKGEASQQSAAPDAAVPEGTADPSGRININTADSQELQQLSGIGEAKAAAIIAYREEHGGFSKPEDLTAVSGIGEGTFSKLKDSITVQ